MSIYKKINKQTGDEALRYIVYDGEKSKLSQEINTHYDIDIIEQNNDELVDIGFYAVFLHNHNENTYVAITYDDFDKEFISLKFICHLKHGDAIMPYYIKRVDAPNEYFDLLFDQSRTYTPEELEEIYPRDKYDTVEVGK